MLNFRIAFPWPVQIYFNVLTAWCLWGSLAAWALNAPGVRQVVDWFELAIWFALSLSRALTIGVKYAYLPPAEVEAQYHPGCDFEAMRRRLFAQGWSDPTKFDLISEQVRGAGRAERARENLIHMLSAGVLV